MNSIFSCVGKVALITGGGTGIGLGIAKALVRSGAKVILVGRRDEVLKKACLELGDQAKWIAGDVHDLAKNPAFPKQCEVIFSEPVSILIHNAGVNAKLNSLEVTSEQFESILTINLTSAFLLTQALIPAMIKQGSGSIIMITSMAAIMGLPRVAAYTASKSALEGLVRTLAVEYGPMGIRVNGIAPGFIETEMTRKAFDGDPERKNKVLSRTPLGKMGSPEDIGSAAVYLSSDAARFVTGIHLPIDGGFSRGF